MSLRKNTLATLVLAFAVVAVACGGASSTALATVNGEDITIEDMRDLRASYQDGDINTNTEPFRVDLSRLILGEALLAAASEDFGIEITEADLDARLADPPPRYAALFSETSVNANLTAYALRHEAKLSVLRDRVSNELMRNEAGFLAGIIDDQPELVSVGCIRHILVDTEPEALAALGRLEAGAGFAELADELSTDTVSEGGLLADGTGCMLPMSRWVPEFGHAAALAPVGELVGPVESPFGFHVILVEERNAPDRDEFIDNPVDWVDGATISSFFTPWFNDEARAADISVNSLVGRWSPEGLGIAPPDA